MKKKVKLNFEVDVETIKLVSSALKYVAEQKQNNLTERQRTCLTNFALNILREKSEQTGLTNVSPIAEAFVNFMGAELVYNETKKE